MSRIAIYTAMAFSAILAMRSSQTSTVTAKMVAGSEACASCHQEIYKSYKKTVMARASGAARQYVQRVLEFNPDYGKAKEMLGALQGKSGRCGP